MVAALLFPRDCPRILLKPIATTTAADLDRWWNGGDWTMVAFVEAAWLARLQAGMLYRYHFPPAGFESLDDAGMWVSQTAVEPLSVDKIIDLPGELRAHHVDLRVLDSLAPLKDVWSNSLHASGIRLRNAEGWA